VREELVQRLEALADAAARARAAHPDDVRGQDAGQAEHRADARPGEEQRVAGVRHDARALERRLEEVVSQLVVLGISTMPPRTASSASDPIATFITSDRSAMWCSGRGSRRPCPPPRPWPGWWDLGVVQVALLELARLGHGSPQKARKIIRHV
jgi:hypothetical protein